jgi:hypothetical protein
MVKLFLYVITAACLLTSSKAGAQTTWFKYEGNPVLGAGWGSWVMPDRVIRQGDIYQMWFTTFSPHRQCYATSVDGIHWTTYPSNPILPLGPLPWDSYDAGHGFVMFTDSTYRMWYLGGDPSTTFRLGLARSPDGITWTKYAQNPIIDKGASGAWDEAGPAMPSVVGPDSSGAYTMWFGGKNSGPLVQIGMATAPNESVWTKSPANPVLSPGPSGSWEPGVVHYPRVIKRDSLYEMWYAGAASTGGPWQIGYATSADGIHWTKYAHNPVVRLGPAGSVDDVGVYGGDVTTSADLRQEGNLYHMWYRGCSSSEPSSRARICYAVSPKGGEAWISPQDSARTGEWVTVTMRVDSPQGLNFTAELQRPDQVPFETLPLFDDGAHGDSLAGDGVFANKWQVSTDGVIFVDLKLTLYDTLSFVLNNMASFKALPPEVHRDSIRHLAGKADATMRVFILDPLKAALHGGEDYRVTFRDSVYATTRVSVFNLTRNALVAADLPVERDSGSVRLDADGLLLQFSHTRPARGVGADSSHWLVGGSNLQGVAYVRPLGYDLSDGTTVQQTAYPADYLVTIADQVVDTSAAYLESLATPMKFTVKNLTENRKVPVVFLDYNGNGQIDPTDEFIVLEKPGDSSPGYMVSWEVLFQAQGSPVLPNGGDSYLVRILKPFSARDTITFTLDADIGTRVERLGSMVPERYFLFQNYPNPFNPVTRIRFDMPAAKDVRLVVYDILGREIVVLVDEKKAPGSYEVTFDGSRLASGVYFYRLEAGAFVQVRRLLLLK